MFLHINHLLQWGRDVSAEILFFLFVREKNKLKRIKGYCSSGTVWSPNTESVAVKLHPNTPGTVSTSNSYLIKETKREQPNTAKTVTAPICQIKQKLKTFSTSSVYLSKYTTTDKYYCFGALFYIFPTIYKPPGAGALILRALKQCIQ